LVSTTLWYECTALFLIAAARRPHGFMA